MIETKQMDTTEVRSFGNKIYNSKEGSPFWFSEGRDKEQKFSSGKGSYTVTLVNVFCQFNTQRRFGILVAVY